MLIATNGFRYCNHIATGQGTQLKEIPPKNSPNFELLGTKNSSLNLNLDFLIFTVFISLKEITPKNHLNFELLVTKNSSWNLDLYSTISEI